MPPKKQHHDETQSVKEKLQGSRNPRTGRATVLNGSNLKEVDNASVHSGQTSTDSNASNVGFASHRACPPAHVTSRSTAVEQRMRS
jgi:hypothetical protein